MNVRQGTHIVAAIVLSGLVAVAPVAAEIHECEGKWTNLPCAGAAPQRAIPERERALVPVAEQPPADRGAPPLADGAVTRQKGDGVSSTGASPKPTPREPLSPRYDAMRKLKKFNNELKQSKQQPLTSSEIDRINSFCVDLTNTLAECETKIEAAKSSLEAKNTPKG
jgi:hypothetical protein